MNLYFNPQLCSYLAVSMAQIIVFLYLPPMVILTSCVYEDLQMSLIKHYLLIL